MEIRPRGCDSGGGIEVEYRPCKLKVMSSVAGRAICFKLSQSKEVKFF